MYIQIHRLSTWDLPDTQRRLRSSCNMEGNHYGCPLTLWLYGIMLVQCNIRCLYFSLLSWFYWIKTTQKLIQRNIMLSTNKVQLTSLRTYFLIRSSIQPKIHETILSLRRTLSSFPLYCIHNMLYENKIIHFSNYKLSKRR